ncbi:MAG: nicotinamide-nucleotide adenylyltransferase, partial [Candidatus Micrarchaeota archaeon]
MAKKKGRALFIGRFQPFHKGHQNAIGDLLKKHDEVIVVIGSAEDSFTGPNPFTTGERMDMIRASFSKGDRSRLIIVPVRDINDNRVWIDHVVSYVPPFTEVYSNNMLVKMLFSQVGILVNPTKMLEREGNEGTYLRTLMAEGNPEWQKHIPARTIEYLTDIRAEE